MFFFCFCWTDLFTSVDVDLWFRFFHLSVPIGLQLLLFWFSTLSRFGCIFYCHPRFSALFFSIFFFKSTQRNNKLKRIYWFHLNKTNYILLLFFFCFIVFIYHNNKYTSTCVSVSVFSSLARFFAALVASSVFFFQ